jgi:hypothetical protein
VIEIRLPIADATMADLRQFVAVTADAPDDMPVASHDHHDELWGIAAVIDPATLQPREA